VSKLEPEASTNDPAVPAWPVLKRTLPDTSWVPLVALVVSKNMPPEPSKPYPDRRVMLPPFPIVEFPAEASTWLPSESVEFPTTSRMDPAVDPGPLSS